MGKHTQVEERLEHGTAFFFRSIVDKEYTDERLEGYTYIRWRIVSSHF
jgi:hypothetical protein